MFPALLLVVVVSAAVAAATEAPEAGPAAELPSFSHEEASVASALAGDDECFAGSSNDGCGLNALQKHGLKKSGVALVLEGSASAAKPSAQPGGTTSPQVAAAAPHAAAAPSAAAPGGGIPKSGARSNAEPGAQGAHAPPLGAQAAAPAVGAAQAALARWRAAGTEWLLPQEAVPGGLTPALALLRAGCSLLTLALLAACICDLLARWRHAARFAECKKKVQHVHRELMRQDHDLPLCPYCIEFVKEQPSSGKVTFHCGHCFHMTCANRFFCEHQEKDGLCPICCEGMPKVREDKAESEVQGSPISSVGQSGRSFLLTSLRRMYPETISEACMLRWASCHVEIWVQEVARPKYQSLLCRCRRR